MERLRLDAWFDESKPQETALPTTLMTISTHYYRYILTFIQCGIVLAAIIITWNKHGFNSSTVRLAIVTSLYVAIYLLRLLPVGKRLSTQRWGFAQFAVGSLEIILLTYLNADYAKFGPAHISYWWGLYLLPVFRFAEIAGITGWLFGLIASFVALWLEISYYSAFENWFSGISKMALIALNTFIPYYIFRLWNLRRQPTQFWLPLATRSIRSISDGYDLLQSVFYEGMSDLLNANWGVLWEFDFQDSEFVAKVLYKYERGFVPHSSWQRYPPPGVVSLGEEIVSAEVILGAWDRMLSGENSVEGVGAPWLVFSKDQLNYRRVIPVYFGGTDNLVGFLEAGMRKPPRRQGLLGVEARLAATAGGVGSVFSDIQQIRANLLKERLIEIEQETVDTATMDELAVEAMSGYFHCPVLLVDYSMVHGKIQTVTGQLSVSKVDLLEQTLNAQGYLLSQLDETSMCQLPHSQGQQMRECYFICLVDIRKSILELLVLVDIFGHLSTDDQRIVCDCARTINMATARKRATNVLQTDVSTDFRELVSRNRLHELALRVREDTLADVVVLYEFEDGKPKLPPIIVGDLKNSDYLLEKPIVIEDPNPILKVSRAEAPLFFSDIQLNPMGKGKNRHGDNVFVAREGILSSVGIPLRTEHNVVGVMWINFRTSQVFDRARQTYYQELFKQLPHRLEDLKSVETVQLLAEQRTRDRLCGELHDHILQDIIAAGAFTSAALKKLPENAGDSSKDLVHTLQTLENTEKKARMILGDLQEINRDSDATYLLTSFVQRLEEEYGVSTDLRTNGIEEIPSALYQEVHPVLEEAIRNAVRHGRASRVVVQSSKADDVLVLVIRDNGKGFDPKPENYGHGIRIMQSRIHWLKGKLQITSSETEGTSIIVEIPFGQRESRNE